LETTMHKSREEGHGVDTLVPWVLTKGRAQPSMEDAPASSQQIFERYYHFFAPGELLKLTREAGRVLGLLEGTPSQSMPRGTRGFEITRDGYEKSNFYVELQLWET